MKFIKKLDFENTTISTTLFLLSITLLGLFLRIQYIQKSDFILNDGGMFYAMIIDLQKNGYSLPVYTSYNFSQIPYAYPPLSFYSAAILNQYLHIDLVTIFRFYPLIFNILSIPAFFFLAYEITQNKRQALLATAFYAILIPGYEWLISGGGLTRSPAQTYFILSLFFFIAFTNRRKNLYINLSIFSASLMTLHHLEYCWVLLFSIVLFSVDSLKFEEFFKIGFIYLVGVGFLTAPYWITVVSFHGITPFISAFQTGDFNVATSFWRLMLMVFTRESIITFINVLAIFGILFSLISGKYRMIIWLLLIIFFDPRSAERVLIFPVTLFASFAVDQVLTPGMKLLISTDQSVTMELKKRLRISSFFKEYSSLIIIGFSIAYPFFLGFLFSYTPTPSLSSLSIAQRDALVWVKNNTPVNSQFINVDPNKTWSVDKTGEWFSTLSERKNIITVQGTEWLPNSAYFEVRDWNSQVKECFHFGEKCLSDWMDSSGAQFDYVYLSKQDISNTNNNYQLLAESLKSSSHFQMVFENEGVIIFLHNE